MEARSKLSIALLRPHISPTGRLASRIASIYASNNINPIYKACLYPDLNVYMRVFRAAAVESVLSSFRRQIRCRPCVGISKRWENAHSARKDVHRYYTCARLTPHARSMSSASELDPTLPLSPAQKDTIYALSTPPGRSGIAVIRVSGPRVLDVYHTVVKRRGNNPHSWLKGPEPWKLHRCSVVDPVSKRVLDEGLAVYFAGASLPW